MIAAEPPIGAAREGHRLVRTCVAFSAVLAVLVAIASFMPARRVWGINHLAFYPVYVRVVLLAIAALSFVPAVARRVYDLAVKGSAALAAHRRLAALVVLAASLGSVGIFLMFHSSTLLLGDGQLVLDSFRHAAGDSATAAASTLTAILHNQPTARGATMLYYLTGGGSAAGIRLVNCLMGGFLIFIVGWLALRSSMPAELRIWLVFLVLTSGAMELFFGYIENYTPPVFFGALYVASGLAFLRLRRAGWLAAALACLVASMVMHVSGVLLVPSFGLLVGWAWMEKRGPDARRLLFPLLLALVLVGTFALAALTPYKSHLLPLVARDRTQGILTPAHGLDTLNELLLLLPAFPVLAALGLGILSQTRKGERGGPPHRSRACAWLPADGAWQFSLLVLAPCLLFLVVFKAELGVPRDWDLFALTSVGLVAVAFVAVDRFLATANGRAGIIAVPIWVISAVLGIGWIGVNANPQRSAARYASILEYERANASYAYEILAKHYYHEAKMPEATGAMEEAVRYSPSPRMYVYLAKLYKAQGRVTDALRVLRETVAAYPPHQGARNDLVLLLDATGSYGELLRVARDGTRIHPEAAVFHFYYGKALMRTGQTEAGIEQLLECKRLNPGPNIVAEVDRMIERR